MCRFGESSRQVFSFNKLILDYDFSQFAYVIRTCAILNWLALPSAVVRFVNLFGVKSGSVSLCCYACFKFFKILSPMCSCAHLTALRRDSIGKSFHSLTLKC